MTINSTREYEMKTEKKNEKQILKVENSRRCTKI